MALTNCLEAKVDWMTSNGHHYDARVARNCSRDSVYGGSITDVSDYHGIDVTGLMKAAGCRFDQNASVYASNDCDYLPEAVAGCTWSQHLSWNHPSHAVLMRKQNGDPEYNDGGDPTSGTK